MQIIRYLSSTGSVLGVADKEEVIGQFPAEITIAGLLGLRADAWRQHIEQAIQAGTTVPLSTQLLAPVDGATEVWAAGVTYKRSMDARREESETPDVYTKVYS